MTRKLWTGLVAPCLVLSSGVGAAQSGQTLADEPSRTPPGTAPHSSTSSSDDSSSDDSSSDDSSSDDSSSDDSSSNAPNTANQSSELPGRTDRNSATPNGGPNPGEADSAPSTAEPSRDGIAAEAEGVQLVASPEEGFGIRSADGRYSLMLGALFAATAGIDVPHQAKAQPGANIRLARMTLGGQLFGRHIRYFLNFELARRPELLDLEMTFEAIPELQLRVGQFRTPFSRQFMIPLFALQLVDRAVVSDFFRANRDVGLSLDGVIAKGLFEYRLGVYNGSGFNVSNDNRELMFLGRLAVAPLGAVGLDETTARNDGPIRLAIGIAGYHRKREQSHIETDLMTGLPVTVMDPSRTRSAGGLDLMLRVGPFAFSSEFMFDRRETEGAAAQIGFGFFAQAGVFVLPGDLEVAARFNLLAPDLDNHGTKGLQRYEVGATYYLVNARVKLQLRYGYTHTNVAVAQLPLPRGHQIVAQVLVAL